jgi:hypothetical protein
MTPTAVAKRVEHIAAVRADEGANPAAIERALVSEREVRAWLDASNAELVGRLTPKVSIPEASIAESSRCSGRDAMRSRERAETLEQTPGLAGALDDGAVTVGHVDAVTRGSKKLDGDQQVALFERVDLLVGLAANSTPERFARRVDLEVKNLQRGDGMGRLERQRRAVRTRTWTDDDGMWNVHGRFDPVTALKLKPRLDEAIEALFAEKTLELAPDDPFEKQRFLAGHALAHLMSRTGSGARPGRPQALVVIDADAQGEPGPAAQLSIPVEPPTRVLAELVGQADASAVVVRNGVVLHAPGELDLGRTTRLANRAQRRALRGLYSTCAIPGCGVGFDRCKIHHVLWWRHCGRTDLDNLLPVCPVHHAKIHDAAWVVALGPNRELTLRLPDGTIRNTGPPTIRAA